MKALSSLLLIGLMLYFGGCQKDPASIPTSSLVSTSPTNPDRIIPFLDGTEIVLVSQREAQEMLSFSDLYTQALSPFDIQAKTLSANANSTDEFQYLQHARSQALEWSPSDFAYMRQMIEEVDIRLRERDLVLDLPPQIKVIRSTAEEEGNTIAYTREGYIVFRGDEPVRHTLFARTIFHIFSRYHPEIRDEMYATINFEACQEISFPSSIAARKISNPNATTLGHYLTVEIDGQPRDVVMINYSDRSYQGGTFYEYLTVKLMEVSGEAATKAPRLQGGEPVLWDLEDATDLNQRIGRNSFRRLHPEEILADHFLDLVLQTPVVDPRFIAALGAVLQD